MSGRLNRDSRREDVRTRRKTLRQSALDAKRGTGTLDEPATRVTRTQNAQITKARQAEEKKLRKAITDREVQKAKPPFNPYVRVKHTGLSPYRSYKDAQKRSRVAPWRAPAPKTEPVASCAAPRAGTSRAPAPAVAAISRPVAQPVVPEMKVAAGVIQFPILPHLHHAQITFRAPAKVQPIPLQPRPTKPSFLPASKEMAKDSARPAPDRRPIRGVAAKAQTLQIPKVVRPQTTSSAVLIPTRGQTAAPVVKQTAQKAAPVVKERPQRAAPAKAKEAAQVEKPARKTAAPATKAAQVVKIVVPVRAKSIVPQKMAPPKAPVETSKPVRARRTEPPVKKARLPLGEAVTQEAREPEEAVIMAKRIQPPARVLRSSARLQHRDKENLTPEDPPLELPLVKRRRTKKPTNVTPNDECGSDGAESAAQEVTPAEYASQPEVASGTVDPSEVAAASPDERVKGLEERSSKLAEETQRLRSLAEEWIALKSSQLPSNAVDEIDSVTGQTCLLITKKFIQYKGLIEGAYKNQRTTLDDLDGFWEMMYIQVEQLDSQYRKLEEMRSRNWASNSPVPIKKPVKVSTKPPKRAAAKAKANFRKFLAEKKKATSSGGAVEEAALASKPQLLSPGLNMSVEEVAGSPIRSAQSSLRRSKTPTRRTPRLLTPAPTKSPLPSPGPSRLRTPLRTPQRPAASPRRSTRASKSARRTALGESPLRVLPAVDSPIREVGSPLRATDSPFRDSPRALENARRASRSIRLSTTMMRVSQLMANELELTATDPLAT